MAEQACTSADTDAAQRPEAAPQPPSECITQEDQLAFLRLLRVTDAQRQELIDAPQQSDLWRKARRARLTGSAVGAAVGHNFYCSHTQLLERTLWDTFTGNDATQYGIEHEDVAVNIYMRWRRQRARTWRQAPPELQRPGMFLGREMVWLGYSPDGILLETNGDRVLLEIKCPYSKKLSNAIFASYYDQIQFGMWMLGCKQCDFVTYTPKTVRVDRYQYHQAYVEEFLLPQANDFYFRKLLPRLVAQSRDLLDRNCQFKPCVERVEQLSVDQALAVCAT